MGCGLIRINFEEEKIEQIFERLDKAKEEIYECYRELEELGVITVEKNDTSKDSEVS